MSDKTPAAERAVRFREELKTWGNVLALAAQEAHEPEHPKCGWAVQVRAVHSGKRATPAWVYLVCAGNDRYGARERFDTSFSGSDLPAVVERVLQDAALRRNAKEST